jgi:hypothetical protein
MSKPRLGPVTEGPRADLAYKIESINGSASFSGPCSRSGSRGRNAPSPDKLAGLVGAHRSELEAQPVGLCALAPHGQHLFETGRRNRRAGDPDEERAGGCLGFSDVVGHDRSMLPKVCRLLIG